MDLNNVVIRPAELDDIDAIADIYSALWCGWLRREEHAQDERLVARFNTVMQAQCSPIALVAELDGKIIAACYVGVYDKGTPRTNPLLAANVRRALRAGNRSRTNCRRQS